MTFLLQLVVGFEMVRGFKGFRDGYKVTIGYQLLQLVLS